MNVSISEVGALHKSQMRKVRVISTRYAGCDMNWRDYILLHLCFDDAALIITSVEYCLVPDLNKCLVEQARTHLLGQ